MMSETEAKSEFVKRLYALANPDRPDRGALAALRRGLGKAPGEAPEMIPYVAPWIPGGIGSALEDEAPYYLVASLFGAHPDGRSNDRDLGYLMRRHLKSNESLDRRVRGLLACRYDRLAKHLRFVISYLKSENVKVDYQRLLDDLRDWDRDGRPVQRRWARSFWGNPPRDTASNETPDGGDPTVESK